MTESICQLLGVILGFFIWAVCVFYAYEWISWNFNLPPATYLECVSLYGTFYVVCGTIGKIFGKK